MTALSEQEKFEQDRKEFGDRQTGVYRGIRWLMRRPYHTYWCGYLKLPEEVSEDQERILDEASHGGLTGGIGEYSYGFDCAHGGDYVPGVSRTQQGAFRNFTYVCNKLHHMIDQFYSV